jgi:hypothetical protein
VGNLHVVGRWGEIFEFLVGEDVDGNQVNLCVTVLASLGSRHFDDLAWALLDDDEAVLSQGRALHRVGSRGTSVGALEGVLMLIKVSNCSLHGNTQAGAQAASREERPLQLHSPGHHLRRPC